MPKRPDPLKSREDDNRRVSAKKANTSVAVGFA